MSKRNGLKFFEQDFLETWIGAWVTSPKSPEDQVAAKLARRAITFTENGSVVMPVAVAAVDVLGMKSLLETKTLKDVALQVAEPFYDLDGPAYQFGRAPFSGRQLERRGFRRMASIFPAWIADTILLARRPDWELGDEDIAAAQAVISLAEYVAKMTKINSLYGVTLRSAIAFGECLVSVGSQYALLGCPTREAAEWEKCQEWSGGMLAPSAIETMRRGAKAARRRNGNDFVPRYPNWLVQYPVPVKPAALSFLPKPCIAFNWVNSTIPGVLFLHGKIPDVPPNAREDVHRKIQNTAAFAASCRSIEPFESTTIDWGE